MYIIAMITMLIDHLGIVFFKDQAAWRIIGRIAMPIYAYCIVLGYKHTSSKRKYMIRLAVIAAISQVPFMMALQVASINVVGTFCICLLALVMLDRVGIVYGSMFAFAALVVLELLPFDYGAYALLLVLAYRYLDGHKLVIAHVVLNALFWLYKGFTYQMFSTVSTVLLIYYKAILGVLERLKINRWVWRSFYPAHLVVLAVLQMIIK